MSEYIKKVDLLAKAVEVEYLGRPRLMVSVAQIGNTPAIEVVRCKECKWLRYCETEDSDLYLDCDCADGGGIPRNEEWFCADGERRE